MAHAFVRWGADEERRAPVLNQQRERADQAEDGANAERPQRRRAQTRDVPGWRAALDPRRRPAPGSAPATRVQPGWWPTTSAAARWTSPGRSGANAPSASPAEIGRQTQHRQRGQQRRPPRRRPRSHIQRHRPHQHRARPQHHPLDAAVVQPPHPGRTRVYPATLEGSGVRGLTTELSRARFTSRPCGTTPRRPAGLRRCGGPRRG